MAPIPLRPRNPQTQRRGGRNYGPNQRAVCILRRCIGHRGLRNQRPRRRPDADQPDGFGVQIVKGEGLIPLDGFELAEAVAVGRQVVASHQLGRLANPFMPKALSSVCSS